MELYFDAHDALNDVKRSKMKCKQLDSQWDDSKKLVEERNIDRDYQRMLRFILGKTEQNKRERDNVIVIDEEDLCASLVQNQHGSDVQALCSRECNMALNLYVDQAQRGEKGKVHNQRRLRKVVGGTNVVEGDNEALKKKAVVQTDTEHLIEYLHEHGKKARATDERKIYQRKIWNVVKGKNFVKEDHGPEKKAVFQIDSAHLDKKPCLRESQVTENPCEHADKVQPVERRNINNQRNLQNLIKGKNMVSGGHEVKKEVFRIDNEHLYEEPDQRSNHRLIQYQNEHVDQAWPVTKYKVQTQRKLKGKNMAHGDNEDRKPMVQIDSENFYRKPGPRNNGVRSHHCERVDKLQPGKKDMVQGQVKLVKVDKGANLVQGDNGLSSQKSAFRKDVAKVQLDHNVKSQSGRKRTHCDAKAAKCSVAHKTNSHENNMEKNGDDEIDPDVEILEDAAFLKNISSFVPSKRFHKSMEDVDFQHLGSRSVCDGFRKQLLDVLRKPFDSEELKRHREAVRDGSYYYYYPDLERKVKRCRYKRGKCLNIFRGFFFWLQNASQEGIFKPWKDGQCLAVEPGSSKISPAPHSSNLDRAKQSNCKILK